MYIDVYESLKTPYGYNYEKTNINKRKIVKKYLISKSIIDLSFEINSKNESIMCKLILGANEQL